MDTSSPIRMRHDSPEVPLPGHHMGKMQSPCHLCSPISRGISTSWVSAVTDCHRFAGPESSIDHFSSDQPNRLSNRRPVHFWNRDWRGSMQLSYWNFFGRPTVHVEKLQIVDTIIPYVAWAETRLRRSYFVWYFIYGGLLEEDVSGKGQTSWRVFVDDMRKGKEGDKTNLTCCCSQYRYCEQGHRPSRGVWASAMSSSMLAILM